MRSSETVTSGRQMTNPDNQNGRRTPRRAGLSVAPILIGVAAPVGQFIFTMTLPTSSDRRNRVWESATMVIALLAFTAALYLYAVLVHRSLSRYVGILSAERTGAIVVSTERSPSLKSFIKEKLQTSGRLPKQAPPVALALLADQNGLEVRTGGWDPKLWYSVNWSDASEVRPGLISTPARVYNGLVVDVVEGGGPARTLEFVVMKPGFSCLASQTPEHLAEIARAMNGLRPEAHDEVRPRPSGKTPDPQRAEFVKFE